MRSQFAGVMRQHTPLHSVLKLKQPPFKMTVGEAINHVVSPEYGYGLGTLLGVEGELTFVTDENQRTKAYITRKSDDGSHQITEPVDAGEVVHFVQGARIFPTFHACHRLQIRADSLDSLKQQIRARLVEAGTNPAHFVAKFDNARADEVVFRTCNGNETVDGQPHEEIGSIIDNQLSWTSNGRGRLINGFMTNSMSKKEVDTLPEALRRYISDDRVTHARDGYFQDSLLHTHAVSRQEHRDVDEGGHVIDVRGFEGELIVLPFNRHAHLITASPTNGNEKLFRPAFSVAETAALDAAIADENTGDLMAVDRYIERRKGPNTPQVIAGLD